MIESKRALHDVKLYRIYKNKVGSYPETAVIGGLYVDVYFI